jgi:carbon-monoxide dehydrogenase small subunit
MDRVECQLEVNGAEERVLVDPRALLTDVLRDELGLTGTKVGCDTAKCGACTVLLDGDPVKACNLLALQAANRSVTTIEGLADDDELHELQAAFWEHYSFQCGYCTPGFIMNTTALLGTGEKPSEDELRSHLKGNICRCTGYVKILEGIERAVADASEDVTDE